MAHGTSEEAQEAQDLVPEESGAGNEEAGQEHLLVERDTRGRFVTSGNPGGRPKGSKNKVTLLKLMAEEAVRERNIENMQRVADEIIQDALNGDKDMRKLVWQAIMSKGSVDDRTQAKEKVEININATPSKEEKVVTIDNPPQEEITDG